MDENKELEKEVVLEKEVKEKETQKKTGKKEDSKDLKASITTFFVNIRSEFKRIIWPKKEELIRQTIIVLLVCAFFGAIIFSMDYVLSMLLGLITKLVG